MVADYTDVAAQGGDGWQSIEPSGLPVVTLDPTDAGFAHESAPDRLGEVVATGRALITGETSLGLPSPDAFSRRYRTVLPQGGQFFFDSAFAYEDARHTFLIEPVRVPSQTASSLLPVGVATAKRRKAVKAALGTGADVAVDAVQAYAQISTDRTTPRDYFLAGDAAILYLGPPTEQKFRVWLFQHPYTCRFLALLRREGVSGLLRLSSQRPDEPPGLDFRRQYHPEAIIDSRYPAESVDFTADGPYSLYNWELFVHAPLLIAQRLRADKQYEQARRWLHYLFNPTAGEGPAPARYWNVAPFQAAASLSPVDELRLLLADPTQLSQQVSDSRHNPFHPWRVARLRRHAIQKSIVMSYLDVLIDWADDLFRQYTRETVNDAAQLYVMAARILGPRPALLPGPERAPETFASLRTRLDSFSNAVISVETRLPTVPSGSGSGSTADPGALRAIGTSFYFCVPPNQRLLSYWDTVADRLFKIRHCQDIDGNVRDLALFEAPIEPDLLVQAVAAGLDLATITRAVIRPPYRFTVALAKALELCGEVRGLGAALASALERRDAEELIRLRSTHELAMLAAIRAVRLAQIDELRQARTALDRSLDIANARLEHYQRLITQGLSDGEKVQLASLFATLVLQTGAGALELASTVANAVPTAVFGVSGFGGTPHTTVHYGGTNIGSALSAASRAAQAVAGVLGTVSSLAGTYAGHDRRRQEWELQTKLADREVIQLNAQVAAAQIRVSMAGAELANHDLHAAQSAEVDHVLRSKFTSAELYDWTADQLSALYFAAYRLAYDAALKAQECFQYEHPTNHTTFVTPGYWDGRRAGLLAGERLAGDLRRMEAAFLSASTREHELVKHISLATLDPLAMVALRTRGVCTFSLDETLFDADHPGHILRRIKSMNVTLPAVIGPYTSVNAALTLVSSRTRLTEAEWRERDDDRPGQHAIATSHGSVDSGLFELNLRDERYLPFEGAGAIGTWQLELDPECNDFDIQSLSDIVVELRYTARDGRTPGDAMTAVRASRSGPQTRLLSARSDFADGWYDFLHPVTDLPGQVLRFSIDPAMFGYRASRGRLTVSGLQLALVLGPTVSGAFPGLDFELDGALYRWSTAPAGQRVTGLADVPATVALAPERVELSVPQAAVDRLPAQQRSGARLNPAVFADLLILVTYTVV
jgi:Tc toxin complex TcA C-terminal TcB-binding domain